MALAVDRATKIKAAVREILGDKPSPIFMGRVDKLIDESASGEASLGQACTRVENLVKLFIGVEESKVIGARCKEIIEGGR